MRMITFRTAIATGLLVAVILFEQLPACTCLQMVIGDGQDPGTCNFSALLDAAVTVSSLDGEHLVLFNCSDQVVISFDDQITLSGHVAVDGQHQVTLDGNGFFRQLSVGGSAGSNVTLMSLVLANGGGRPPRLQGRCEPSDVYCISMNVSDPVEKYDGGCLYASSEGILVLLSVTFVNCSCLGDPVEDPLQHANDVTFMGEAIYADYYTTIFISNSTFVNNKARHEGGAIYKLLPDQPGVSAYPSSLVISGSVFEGNAALGEYDPTNTFRETSGGGAIFSSSNMLICGSLFLGNSAEMLGGAIRSLSSDLFIDNSIFINNTVFSADNASIAAKGGSIHTMDSDTACDHGRATIQITNSVFVSNEAPASAGALYISLPTVSQTVTIRNTSFVANKVSQNNSDTEPPAPAMSLSCDTPQSIIFDGVKLGFSSIAEQRIGLDASVSVAADCIGATGLYADISSFEPEVSEMDDNLAEDWLSLAVDRDALEALIENNETCYLTLPLVPCPPDKPPVTDITKKPIPGDTTTGTSTARITKATTSAARVTKDTTTATKMTKDTTSATTTTEATTSATTVTKATTSATTMTEATTLAATTSAHFAKQPLPTPVPTTTASAKLATGYNHELISR